MLDIKFIKDNLELVKQNNLKRNFKVDLEKLLDIDKERLKLISKIDELRAERNKRSKTKPSDSEIALMKKIGDEISDLDELLADKEDELNEQLMKLPNLTHESVPEGKDETENKILKTWGDIPKYKFKPLNHLEIGERLGIIDTKTATAVSGTRFAYLKGNLVMLQFALIQHVLNIVTSQSIIQEIITKNDLKAPNKPFSPVIPPVMIKPEVYQKMGRLEPKVERYHINSNADDIYLIGSAEHTLGPIYMDKTIPEAELPIRYIGYSTAFRREAGSYGKDTKGIFRVHQFDKLEFESFTTPENSLTEQNFIIAVQEYLMQSLNLPYRVVLKCTGDMGQPDYRELDIEAWIPSQNTYRETHTADLMTDFQSRRLNIKVKKSGDQSAVFAHMNDATAFAIGRTLIAILENYQQSDGRVTVPDALKKYLSFEYL